MLSNWDPKTPSLLPTLICYADILGFREMTERAYDSGEEAEFLQRIKRSLDAAYKVVREARTLDGLVDSLFEMKIFTDNIVVAYPLFTLNGDDGEYELGTLLMLFAEVQARLAVDGFFVRGGIAYGEHYQDDDIAYGKALMEAVDLDESSGAPRLVIASSVEPLILSHLSSYSYFDRAPHYYHLLEDPKDGRLFVNYLEVAFEYFPDDQINHQLLAEHKKMVCSRLREYESDPRIRQKYEWIATYHNYVCKTFADQYQFQGYEEADLERMTYCCEAQSVLEHFVDFEANAEVQAPRPINVQRLQQLYRTT